MLGFSHRVVVGTRQVMADICHEAESFVEYEELFQKLIKTAPTPMSIFESLASSSVRAQQKTHAKLIIVLSRTGKTVRYLSPRPFPLAASPSPSPSPASRTCSVVVDDQTLSVPTERRSEDDKMNLVNLRPRDISPTAPFHHTSLSRGATVPAYAQNAQCGRG